MRMKEEGTSVIHGLELQGRALCSVVADTDNVAFLVGTQSLRHPNMIYRVLVRRKNSRIKWKYLTALEYY